VTTYIVIIKIVNISVQQERDLEVVVIVVVD
jgi:hypothetical protein